MGKLQANLLYIYSFRNIDPVWAHAQIVVYSSADSRLTTAFSRHRFYVSVSNSTVYNNHYWKFWITLNKMAFLSFFFFNVILAPLIVKHVWFFAWYCPFIARIYILNILYIWAAGLKRENDVMCVQNGHYCVIFMLLLKLIHFKKGVHDGEKCPSYIQYVLVWMERKL